VPGGPAPSPALGDVANSPSERRLHRESEQVFRLLQAAADAVVEAIADLGRPLVLRNCGAGDVVSLRGVMRAAERSRAAGVGGLVVCGEWDAVTAAGRMGDRKQRMLDRVRERMRAPLDGEAATAPAGARDAGFESAELRHLQAATDEGRPPAERLAGALLAVRACFFSTNYEGSLLACEHALRVLDSGTAVDTDDVARAFEAMDEGIGTPAIEVNAEALAGPVRDLEALLWRSIAVDYSLMNDGTAGSEAFHRALAAEPTPLAEATVRMYLGLLLGKRMGKQDEAVAELQRGLALLDGDARPRAAVAEGWLRNVLALTSFQRRQLREAYEEEMKALRRVADRHDPSATHLKINVISNVSVIHESAGRHADAIRIWHRFLEISPDWSDSFIKHYAYREGGLNLAAGDEAALVSYRRSHECAVATGDDYYGCIIASELGGHHLAEGREDEARRWFREGLAHARRVGDPYRLGMTMTGLALAGGDGDPAAAAALLRLATTHDRPAQELAAAVESGDRAAQLAALPRPATKLNRPFDLVNI
jgi:tetratricopeptide (TPR) repeat protein